MSDFGASDYSIFDNAISTTTTLSNSINEGKTKTVNCQTRLDDESTFMGPICESCLEGFNSVLSKIEKMTTNYSEFSTFFSDTKDKYKSGDQDSAKTVTKSGENNSSTSTTTSSVSSYSSANDTMKSVADTARANAGGGYDGLCEMWAELQWQSATGINRENQVSARDAWLNFGVSSDKDNIPVGAMVYSTGSGTPAGHVGIYVGDGQVADQGGVEPLDDWISHHNGVNMYGESGWLGWGWQNGVDLTQQ